METVTHPVQQTSAAIEGTRCRIYVLGRFAVERDGQPVPSSVWQRAKAKALLKALAVQPGHRLHQEQLMDMLWPELNPQSAANSLRVALSRARRALEPERLSRTVSSYVQLIDGSIVLDTHAVWIDIDHFRQLAHAAVGSSNVESYQRAIAAYGGELLPEDRYDHWLVAPRQEAAEAYMTLLLELATLLEREASYVDAATYLKRALREDPAFEDAHRRLMQLYARTGSRALALRQYDHCVEALRQELDVEPDEATQAIYRGLVESEHGSGHQDATSLQHAGALTPPGAAPLPPAARSVSAVSLVGRDRPLHVILSRIQGVEPAGAGESDAIVSGYALPSTSPPVIVLTGEAGVGKTRLAVEAARRAHAEGAVVLWGGSYEQEGQSPYGPFIEAIEGYLAGRSHLERATLADHYPHLRDLLPSLSTFGAAPGAVVGGGQGGRVERQQAALFAAFCQILQHVAEAGTAGRLLLVLDDLHLADSASLQLLHHIARTTASQPDRRWAVLGICREEALPGPSADQPGGGDLPGLMLALNRSGLCTTVDLLRLSRQDCRELVASLLGESARLAPALLDHIYAASLGNPLFVTLLVRTMVERGAIVRVDDRWDLAPAEGHHDAAVSVPRGVRDLVEARVDALSEDSRRLVELAAVIGMDCSYRVLRAAASLAFDPAPSEPRIIGGLERALEARLLEERTIEDGPGYAFRHPLLRAAIYTRLSGGRRMLYHDAVAAAIERHRPDDANALAFHLMRSAEPERALPYLHRAAQRARDHHAYAAASAHYAAMVDQLEAVDRRAEAAEVRREWGEMLRLAAQYDEALAVLDAAANAFASMGNDERLAETVAEIGRAYASSGNPADGFPRVQALVERLQTRGPSPGLGALYLSLAHLAFVSGKHQDQLAAAERAAEMFRALGDRKRLVHAEERRGSALQMLVRYDEALAVLERLAETAQDVGDYRSAAHALNNLAVIHDGLGHPDQRGEFVHRALEITRRVGDPAQETFMTYKVALHHLYIGEWVEARSWFERALRLSRDIGPSWVAAYPYCGIGDLRLMTGEWEAARDSFERCVSLADDNGDIRALRWGTCYLADLDLLEGKAGAALDRLRTLLARLNLPEADAVYFQSTLARAYMELGDRERAQQLAASCLARAREEGNVVFIGEALHVHGQIAAACGRRRQARESLEEALHLFTSMKRPYDQAKVLVNLGKLLASGRGERSAPRAAVDTLQHALGIFQRLGAHQDVRHTEQEIQRLQRRVQLRQPATSAGARSGSDLTDEQWRMIEPLLPPTVGRGRARVDDRRTLDGIFYVLTRECRWQDVPREYGSPTTIWRRWSSLKDVDTWETIRRIGMGKER